MIPVSDITAIILILLISGLFILCYGEWVRAKWDGDDMLKTTIIPDTDIDYWSVLHFFLFFIFGRYFPDYIPFFIVFGVVWEAIESATGDPEWRKTYLGDSEFKGDKYWYTKISDIMVDILGLTAGFMTCSISL